MELYHATNAVGLASLAALAVLALSPSASQGIPAAPTVSIVTDSALGPGAAHGLAKVLSALESKGVSVEQTASLQAARGKHLIVLGTAEGRGPAASLLKDLGTSGPAGPEALLIRRAKSHGRRALLVVGSDDRGLMYAELDVAGRIGWAPDPRRPLSEVREAEERAAVVERAVSKYTMNRSCFESYFYDEAYWARYLDMLAQHRFNAFVLIFGYENAGYFAPPYPYFFDVEGFPDVRVVGITQEQQRRNLAALNRIIAMTRERGLGFRLGIWDHIYRGGVQGPSEHARTPTPGLVWGLSGENLIPYTTAALAKFLNEVPELNAIQFRMHGESGLKRGEMDEFWEAIYHVVKDSGREIRFDARAKNFPDSLIDKALDMGVNIRICTKYWAEQMGLPFHPTHINRQNQLDRRHGYADLLRYPKRYQMHWRLWNGGTTRILLWGDPDYVRRFAESTHLYDGEGFEINEPVATKMQDHPHDMAPFELLRPKYQYYDWEFERYWHFLQLWGRLGYNPDTPTEVWHREFERRFGREAAPYVERGIHRASQVLPRIVAYCFPYHRFPTTRGWVEKQRREDLPEYAKAEPSDTEQFLSIADAARRRLEGTESPKVWPQQTSEWFAQVAEDVLESADQAEARIGRNAGREFVSTMVDLRILAYLALYHSRRVHAGLGWVLFQRAHDLNALDDAIEHERSAIEAWEKLVEAAGDVYHDDLMMGRRGAGLAGHWRDELVELQEGLADLVDQRNSFRPTVTGPGPAIAHVPVRKALPGKGLVVRATVGGPNPIASVRVGYGTGGQGYRYAAMEQTGAFLYRGVIPGSDVRKGLEYFVEAADAQGGEAAYPERQSQGRAKSSVVVTVTRDHQPPTVVHTPIRSAPAEKPLAVTADVRDPSGVKWVRLRYRSVTQFEDYRTLPMLPTGKKHQYQAVVPGAHVVPEWDFMYFIEVMDNASNGRIHPDLEKETPYVVVRLQRGDAGR